MKKTIGGDRLGGGKKMQAELHGFGRSTHNLDEIFRSTMAAGTLVPFYKILALPGDTMDIDLDIDVLTSPTIGPLFGSFKVHVDMFMAPVRLYQGQLHQNKLGIGLNMSSILLPQITVEGNVPVMTKPLDNQHVNPSCLLKYLGISGTGFKSTTPNNRNFNAVAYLAYWEIYKQYYANKQETNGVCVHTSPIPPAPILTGATTTGTFPAGAIPINAAAPVNTLYSFVESSQLTLTFTGLTADFQISQILFDMGDGTVKTGYDLFDVWEVDIVNLRIIATNSRQPQWNIGRIRLNAVVDYDNVAPKLFKFPLANIDQMRSDILAQPIATALTVTNASLNPYNLPLNNFQIAAGPPIVKNYSMQYAQEALAVRTYASDLFNNWLETTTIDGGTGINEVTKVNVVGNKFTIDELNLAKKVYEMLNRIAISGGTYDDWLDAVYLQERTRAIESPVYLGGLMTNLIFQEVVSTAAQANEPLGSLAGRGKISGDKKGGKITVKVDEPSYVIGIVSLVPRLDYSQGNDWEMNLKTMNDFHKPSLDEIGFQNLITDQMAWFDTLNVSVSSQTFRSAGKQPAWINYMTAYNKVYGNFADENQQMFMVLARKYSPVVVAGATRIDDLTTYIDPSKFNNIFADVRLDAQNFWVQIAIKNTARRKMSAKVIPNL